METVTPPAVTVIVGMRNSATTITECLSRLVAQRYPIREILLFDNGSTDSSVQVAEAFIRTSPLSIQLTQLQGNGGISLSYNTGAQMASSELLVFVHSDGVLPTDNELERLVEPLLENPQAVASCSMTSTPREVWERFSYWQKFLFSRPAMRVYPCMCGKFDCIRREVFLKRGGLNAERFSATCNYVGEDSDLVIRLRKEGPILNSKAVVVHVHDLSATYGLKALFRSRKRFACCYGLILQTHGLFPFWEKLGYFAKPCFALLPVIPSGLILSAINSYRMYIEKSTLLDRRIFLVPLVDIALMYYETFWFIYGLIVPPIDLAKQPSSNPHVV
jgi:glycosyltransferase involved in cell wall biosynthesis